MRHAFALVLTVVALALPQGLEAQAPLIGGLGGAAGYGENSLVRNDDSSSGLISMSGAFPAGLRFYGSTYTGLYLNNNGNVSFGSARSTYTPTAFPMAAGPMIAPWWADVDTRNTALVPATRNLVYWDLEPGRFIATWYDVGYYNNRVDRWNAFQLVITDASASGVAGSFDVEFRYNRCEWTTGDLSGSVAAQAGFDAGDGVNYLTLPGSRTAAVVNLCTTSNVGETGVWRFQVRPGGVTTCGNGTREVGEDCDDGNVVGGDGCSARCLSEGGSTSPGPCTRDADCSSGYCTDGVCCDRRCGGQCEACNEIGRTGLCTAVTGAPRGGRTACLNAGTTCGGRCDGATTSVCTFSPVTAACDDGLFCTSPDRCNGAGSCAGTTRVCDDGRSCTVDACNETTDRCTTTPAATGTACDDGFACTSMDRCSATGACVGTGIRCPDDGLTCTTHACTPASGLCETTVATGCAIAGACVADGVRSASNPCLVCDPRVSSTTWTPVAAGTTCSASSCASGVVTPAGACDGAGACVVGPSVACPSRDCSGPMCASPCTSDADCARPTWCDTATGACTPDLPNGDLCGRAGMCLSELCIDGVCCGDRCTGTCRSCTVPGSEGECAFIPAGSDPDDECPGVLACDVDGKCETFDAGRVSLDASVPARDAAYLERTDASRPDTGPVDSSRDAGRFDPDALFLQFDASGPPPDSGPIDASLRPPVRTAGACICRVGSAGTRPAAGLALIGLAFVVLRARRALGRRRR